MKKKIKLTALKVESFVTALSEEEKALAKGGEGYITTAPVSQTPSVTGCGTYCKFNGTCNTLSNTTEGVFHSCYVFKCTPKD